jgi:hypothetical protein
MGGIIKWLCKRFKCGSECMFNVEDLPIDLLDIDLSKYQLKDEDLKRIWKIQSKRPSVHNYKHQNPRYQNAIEL